MKERVAAFERRTGERYDAARLAAGASARRSRRARAARRSSASPAPRACRRTSRTGCACSRRRGAGPPLAHVAAHRGLPAAGRPLRHAGRAAAAAACSPAARTASPTRATTGWRSTGPSTRTRSPGSRRRSSARRSPSTASAPRTTRAVASAPGTRTSARASHGPALGLSRGAVRAAPRGRARPDPALVQRPGRGAARAPRAPRAAVPVDAAMSAPLPVLAGLRPGPRDPPQRARPRSATAPRLRADDARSRPFRATAGAARSASARGTPRGAPRGRSGARPSTARSCASAVSRRATCAPSKTCGTSRCSTATTLRDAFADDPGPSRARGPAAPLRRAQLGEHRAAGRRPQGRLRHASTCGRCSASGCARLAPAPAGAAEGRAPLHAAARGRVRDAAAGPRRRDARPHLARPARSRPRACAPSARTSSSRIPLGCTGSPASADPPRPRLLLSSAMHLSSSLRRASRAARGARPQLLLRVGDRADRLGVPRERPAAFTCSSPTSGSKSVEGELVVTRLRESVLPLLRYRTGDAGEVERRVRAGAATAGSRSWASPADGPALRHAGRPRGGRVAAGVGLPAPPARRLPADAGVGRARSGWRLAGDPREGAARLVERLRATLVALGWHAPRIEHARVARATLAAAKPEPFVDPGRREPSKGRPMTPSDRTSKRSFPTQAQIPADAWRTPDDAGLTLLVDGERRLLGRPARRDPLGRVRARRERPARAARRSGPARSRAPSSRARPWTRRLAPGPAVAASGRAPRRGERIACMLDFVRRARPLREPVARALMWEVGKPWPDCLVEFDRTFEYIEDTAETLRQIERDAAAPVPAGGFVARIRRAPLGVALCIGPYNYAVNEVFTTVIPALVMGNPVVMKTPRYGVLANALLVARAPGELPDGRHQPGHRPGAHRGRADDGERPRRRAGAHRLGPHRGRPAEAAPASVPAAHAPRHGGQEPRDRARGRRSRRWPPPRSSRARSPSTASAAPRSSTCSSSERWPTRSSSAWPTGRTR